VVLSKALLALFGVMAASICVAAGFDMPAEPPVPLLPKIIHQNLSMDQVFQPHEQILPQAWVLRIDRVLSKGKAGLLVEKLVKAGWPAYSVADAQGVQVFIGPNVSQQRLENMKQQLQKKLGLLASIEDYQIAWPRP